MQSYLSLPELQQFSSTTACSRWSIWRMTSGESVQFKNSVSRSEMLDSAIPASVHVTLFA